MGCFGLCAGLAVVALAAHAAAPMEDEATSSDDTTPGANRLPQIVVRAGRPGGLAEKNQELDQSRNQNLLPSLGASTYEIDQSVLQALPQGQDTPLDKVLLQVPGVSYDSAISNPDFHVRNEYSNVQYRINGIELPDGVSALGPILETAFISNLALLDGALPAQYGLRTAGVVDITTKSGFDTGGKAALLAGSLGMLSPSIEYGGSAGETQYFLIGRYLESKEGLESATPTVDPIHDRTTQEKFFGYGSTIIGDFSRLSYMAGAWVGRFQIPDVAGLAPLGDFGPDDLSSTTLNENETDRFFFDIVALQTKYGDLDTQFSVFTRYADVHFVPDLAGDLAFNDVASNVTRRSLLNGAQFDAADRLDVVHVLRAGFIFGVEQTKTDDLSTVLPLGPDGNPCSESGGLCLPVPLTLNDYTAKVGGTLGAYIQDEWTLRSNLTLNTGVRFDAMKQFVSAHQWSPRIALIYDPATDTRIHVGVARYFTPPMQAQATPVNLALFQNTTQQQANALEDPVRPERATYADAGIDQKISPSLSLGADVYFKYATDPLDDGQFGQAVVLDQYNYARGFSRGAELKMSYERQMLRVYANVSAEITKAKDVISNQYLIDDPIELAYLANNYTYTSDAQTFTASAGASYRWHGMLASIDGIYGSGLRTGFANLEHTPGYTQWNAAIAREFDPWGDRKPLSLRLSAINLFDRTYLLRSGSGIGEFAPQYGPRRGLFAELAQRF